MRLVVAGCSGAVRCGSVQLGVVEAGEAWLVVMRLGVVVVEP